MQKSLKKSLSQRNKTNGPAENKNRFGITQLVMAKIRNISKLIHCNQKQRSNKEPQEAEETTPEAPQIRKQKGTGLKLLR